VTQSSGRHRFERVASATGAAARASVGAPTAGSIAMTALISMLAVSNRVSKCAPHGTILQPQGCIGDAHMATIACPSRTKSARKLSESIIAGRRLIVGA
jgi:hypothetical protein